jgi:hypothetical protein
LTGEEECRENEKINLLSSTNLLSVRLSRRKSRVSCAQHRSIVVDSHVDVKAHRVGVGPDRTIRRTGNSSRQSTRPLNISTRSIQLPIKCGELTNQMRLNLEQNKECLIGLSRYKFSLVINGFTDILKSIDNTVTPTGIERVRRISIDFRRDSADTIKRRTFTSPI